MVTRVVRIQATDARSPRVARRVVDPAGTVLTAAISGAVLVATIAVASLSIGGSLRSASVAQQPEPAPPPSWTVPLDEGRPVSP